MTSDPEQIEHFVAYVLGNTAKLAALTPERSQGDILHWMCERKADRLTICDIMSPSISKGDIKAFLFECLLLHSIRLLLAEGHLTRRTEFLWARRLSGV